MKKQFIISLLFVFVSSLNLQSQSIIDLFKSSTIKVTWLGVDYSNVKLIGDFTQFSTAGSKSSVEIKNQYFPRWNNLILSESEKYDVKGMLRKEDMKFDINMITEINAKASAQDLETNSAKQLTKDEIKAFVKAYPTTDKDGIGIVFIAEKLDKLELMAYYHFVAFNMKTKEVILQERIEGAPAGFGLRNYWAGSIYAVIKKIKSDLYKSWKKECCN